MSDPAPSSRTPRAVAVVAVHGVADQQPGRSVRQVGDLLLRLREGGREIYRGFREMAIRLPLRRVEAGGAGTDSRPSPKTTNERPSYVLDAMKADAAATGSGPPPHHRFNRLLLHDYPGSCGTYDTVRLEGERDDGRTVHLYELYWADLSRVGQGLVAILGAFYQLALHLPVLGRVTVDHALVQNPGDPAWRRFARFHAWAVRALTLFFPLVVLLTVLTLLGLLPGALPGKEWVALGVLVFAGVAVAGWLRYHKRDEKHLSTWAWAAFPIGLGAALFGIGRLLLEPWGPDGRALLTADQLLILLGIVLASAVFFGLVGIYDRYRPGAKRWGCVLWFALFLAPMLWVAFHGDAGAPADGVSRIAIAGNLLHLFEAQLNLTLVLAAVFYALALLSAFFSRRVVHRARDDGEKVRNRRTAWTALATLTLATMLFYFGTLLIGAGALVAADPLLPRMPSAERAGTEEDEPAPSPPHQPKFDWNRPFAEDALAKNGQEPSELTQAQALRLMFRFGATSGITIVVAGLALMLALAVWGLAPAVWKEIRPPSGQAARDPRGSESLGRWLDRAYGTFAGLMNILFVFVFVLSPALTTGRILDVARGWNVRFFDYLWLWNDEILTIAGAMVAASAVGLAFHGRLRSLALGFRPVLDVALDVDGYLRDLPRDATPRARMFERYASLLRYLGTWRDENDRPYSAIVLVAHSQGSVLTADLLDFLRREPDSDIPWLTAPDRAAGPRVYLFTMGSPLAQLYARNFPSLYGRFLADDPFASWPGLPDDRLPDPDELGLREWVNVYRSGDYVGRLLWRHAGTEGRNLWSSHDDADRPSISEDATGRRRERCLGGGAHTHYWDATADTVAEELDRLITT